MIAAMNGLEVISLFTEDLAATRAFYFKVFAHEIIHEDDVCTVLRIGNIAVNLLNIETVPELIDPAKAAGLSSGARALYTVNVKDCDGVCAELKALGVPLLNGPMDRPWGRRTAAFADPAGNVWEVAQELAAA